MSNPTPLPNVFPSSRHLLGIKYITADDIYLYLDTARTFREVLERPVRNLPTLRGVQVVNLFFENSTRTRLSFELAEKRLGADVLNFQSSGSSVAKGETLLDTIRNIEAMKVDAVVMRHSAAGAPLFLSERIKSIVINAGDGAHEHPTQALLDLYTIREKFKVLKGLKVTLVGDISHSRVAMSNLIALQKVGAVPAVCGPSTMIPKDLEKLGYTVYHHVDEAIQNSDVLNVLRIQHERAASGTIPSIREYRKYFGINRKRLEKATKPLLIMHPGPINRGVELDSDVADGEHSVILDQVTNGVAIRMAILYLLCRGVQSA
ncbi:MAG: aspartate carbamoyltransferase catalytic subunit [bacterium]|nr:aspartate carbamoyltransferase catalytic subunit [bacterium]